MEWDCRSLGLKLQKEDRPQIFPNSAIFHPCHQAHNNRNTKRALCPTGTSASCSSSEQCCPHCNCSVLALVWSSTLPSSSLLCRQGQSPGKATLLRRWKTGSLQDMSGLSSKYMLALLNLSQHRAQGTFIRQCSLKAPLWIAILSLVSTGILFLLSYLGIFFSSLNLATHGVCPDFFVWTLNTSSWLSRTFF